MLVQILQVTEIFFVSSKETESIFRRHLCASSTTLQKPSGHFPLKVPNVEFNFNVSVRHFLLSAHTLKLNLTLGNNLHAMLGLIILILTLSFDLTVHLYKKPNIEYKFDVRPLAEWLKGLEYPQNQSDQFNLRGPGFESRVRDGFSVEGIN